jgi:alpha-1,3-mannosyltransferase
VNEITSIFVEERVRSSIPPGESATPLWTDSFIERIRFLYVYSLFYYVCEKGKSILTAQLLFAFVYVSSLLLQMLTLAECASKAGWTRKKILLMFLMMCLSRRLHSIYVLRLFNDCIAMLFFHISFFFIVSRGRWLIGCTFFSLAVSIKV